MRLLIDVDGPCADFVGGLLELLGLSAMREHFTRWEIIKDLERYRRGGNRMALEALAKPGFWEALEPVQGAVAAVGDLRGMEHELVFVTAPWLSCLGWGHTRRAWLHQHFDADHRNIIITSRKELVRGDLLLDDKVDNVLAFMQHTDGEAYLFDTPHNRELPGSLQRLNNRRVDWGSFVELMTP